MLSPVLFSSDRTDWCTPQCVIDKLREFEPRGIALDPCSNDRSIVGAREEWRIERGEDGLAREWHSDGGLCYVNPPYGSVIAKWTARMRKQGLRGVEQIGLLPAKTDTLWFQSFTACADALCFWRGRLQFGEAIAGSAQMSLYPSQPGAVFEESDPAPFPSVLPYFGQRRHRFKRVFESVGWVVLP